MAVGVGMHLCRMHLYYYDYNIAGFVALGQECGAIRQMGRIYSKYEIYNCLLVSCHTNFQDIKNVGKVVIFPKNSNRFSHTSFFSSYEHVMNTITTTKVDA